MFDFKFDWKDDLNTGIYEVDQQHKEIFRIVRDMEQLLIIRCIGVEKEQLYDIVCQIREFISYHFYEEEELMKKYNYSLIEQHTKSHKVFYDKVIAIDVPKLWEDPFNELSKIKEMVQDWIFEHMFQADKHLGIEILAKMNE